MKNWHIQKCYRLTAKFNHSSRYVISSMCFMCYHTHLCTIRLWKIMKLYKIILSKNKRPSGEVHWSLKRTPQAYGAHSGIIREVKRIFKSSQLRCNRFVLLVEAYGWFATLIICWKSKSWQILYAIRGCSRYWIYQLLRPWPIITSLIVTLC